MLLVVPLHVWFNVAQINVVYKLAKDAVASVPV